MGFAVRKTVRQLDKELVRLRPLHSGKRFEKENDQDDIQASFSMLDDSANILDRKLDQQLSTPENPRTCLHSKE